MANIKSAEKRVEVAKRQALRNKMIKTNLKTTLKKADLAIENNSSDKDAVVRYAVKRIDQACAKGVIKKNCASRKKSNLVQRANKPA